MSFSTSPVPHSIAAAQIADKPAMIRGVFDQLLPDLRARAFTVTGITHRDTIAQARDLISRIPEGADWDEQKDELADLLTPFLGDQAERRAELLLRQHGFMAYAASNYQALEASKDLFPYRKYQTAQDERVRPTHRALNGLILPADSPFWKRHTPPWAWGCRCDVVGMMLEDVEVERKRDKRRAGSDQRVFDPGSPQLAKLEGNGELVRGSTKFDLRTPFERDGEHEGFEWEPGSLLMPIDKLEARVDAKTWKEFENWARGAFVPETNGTVLEWLGGKSVRSVAKPTTPAAASVATVAPVASADLAKHRQDYPAVSKALDVKVRSNAVKASVKEATDAIEAVHGDGVLPKIPVDGSTGGTTTWGEYSRTIYGDAVRIGLKSSGPRRELTMVHEVGHFLDHQAMLSKGKFASQTAGSVLDDWREVVMKSDAISEIKKHAYMPASYREYLLRGREIFARSYAQYVAVRSGNATLLSQLKDTLNGASSFTQWTEEEFEPIAEAMDAAFDALGWRRPER